MSFPQQADTREARRVRTTPCSSVGGLCSEVTAVSFHRDSAAHRCTETNKQMSRVALQPPRRPPPMMGGGEYHPNCQNTAPHTRCQCQPALVGPRPEEEKPTESQEAAGRRTCFPLRRAPSQQHHAVVDLYWGVDPEEWDSPDLQRLRMKLLEECLQTSAGPCFVVSVNTGCNYTHERVLHEI
ncbi:unnamed protein product [Pleuronectes platessa]|uniref:Uncharacterized protein n=1 Tax=Pleuronectes platessa TaxID=8262 RepID=A0A9N7UZ43_PLEPL|nr:unnamed protein product [Pleuronectes platessa]